MSEAFTLVEKLEIISKLHYKVEPSNWLRISEHGFLLKDTGVTLTLTYSHPSRAGDPGLDVYLRSEGATIADASHSLDAWTIEEAIERLEPKMPETIVKKTSERLFGIPFEKVLYKTDPSQEQMDEFCLRHALWTFVSRFGAIMESCEPGEWFKKELEKRQQEQSRIERERARARRILDDL